MSGDVSKLPRWAQQRIERLEADYASAVERLRARDAGETVVEVRAYGGTGDGFHLSDDAAVQWTLPYLARDGRPATVEVRLGRDATWLTVHASGGALNVRPSVSNSVLIGVEQQAER